MFRPLTILFGIFLITISLFGMAFPTTELSFFLTINNLFTVGRLVAGIFLLAYGVSPYLRLSFVRQCMWLIGILFATITVMGLFNSSFIYLRPIDLFISVEGASLALVAYLDFPYPAPQPNLEKAYTKATSKRRLRRTQRQVAPIPRLAMRRVSHAQ